MPEQEKLSKNNKSMFKAMGMALKPTEKLLQQQKVLLTHLTRNSYKSAEEKLESGKAQKLKAAEEKKQSGFLYQLLKQNKLLENTGKNTMKWLGEKWKWIAAAGLFLLPKSFWTGLKDFLNIAIAELPKIFKSIKDGTFLDDYGGKLGGIIGKGFALYLAGSAFKAIVLPALGTIFSTAISSILLKKTIENTIKKNLPAGGGGGTRLSSKQTGQKAKDLAKMKKGLDGPGREAALNRVQGKPSTIPNNPKGFGKFGKFARLTGGAIGKIALPAGVAFALFDSKETFSEEGFQKGMAHAVESFTMGLLPKEASEKVFKTVEDGVKKSATAITNGFVAASKEISDGWSKISDGWSKIKNYNYSTLLDPIKKQLDEKQKKKDEGTKIPSTSTSLDLSDDAQKGRLKDKVAKAEQEMIAAKGSKAKAKAGQKLMTAKSELANYGKLVKKTGTRTKAPNFVGGTGTSKSGIQQLKDDEGFRSKVYDDTEGIKTIGFGFNLERAGTQKALDSAGIKKSVADLKSGKVNLTEKEAEKLMMGEYPYFRQAAKRYLGEDKWPPFPESKKDALTNMAYNLGEKSLNTFTNLREALRNGDYELAGQEVLKSKYATQVGDRAQRISGALSASVTPMDKSNAFNAHQNKNNELTTPAGGGGNTTIVNNNITKKSDSSSMVVTAEPSANDPKNIFNSTK